MDFNDFTSISINGVEIDTLEIDGNLVWQGAADLDWFKLTAGQSNSTVSMTKIGSAPTVSLQYSTDGSNWSDFVVGETTVTLANVGDYVLFKAGGIEGNTRFASGSGDYNVFSMTGKLAASGSVMTLLNGKEEIDEIPQEYCFYSLFQNCSSLTTPPDLPATRLKFHCYDSMFAGCSSLASAPELPATTLQSYCYRFMFNGCVALTQAPDLPAQNLKPYCYDHMFQLCSALTDAPTMNATKQSSYSCQNMFQGCTSLSAAPELSATTLDGYCYSHMFQGCSALSSAPELPATTLKPNCYEYMFHNCTALTEAPELNATTLAGSCYKSMFQGCTALSASPELNATTLAGSCYQGMFNGCTSLRQAPKLPAPQLEWGCYQDMFNGCRSLTHAPELSATTLAQSCYQDMFNGCRSLEEAPELPATTLASSCYSNMFNGCSALSSAPELPATTLANQCYQGMFSSCSSLTKAPDLPATTLNFACYYNMFSSCRSLTKAPELPATELASYCYQSMFYRCSSLNEIKLGYEGDFSTTYFNIWVTGVASTGTFHYKGSDTTRGTSAIPEGWTIDRSGGYLMITPGDAPQARLTVVMEGDSPDIPEVALEYQTSRMDSWETTTYDVQIADDEFIKVRCPADKENTGFALNDWEGTRLRIDDECDVSGDIMYLLTQDVDSLNGEIPSEYCFANLFRDCGIKSAPELPATTLNGHCYRNMFYGCHNLEVAPDLPATDMRWNCYQSMFGDCYSLIESPELPATDLSEECYSGMFTGCSSLSSAPELLPATTLAINCYQGMFGYCGSLTKAPELPATQLEYGCYHNMFSECSSLNEITLGYSGNFESDYFDSWVDLVSEEGTFYYNGSDIRWGSSSIPDGWTVQKNNYIQFTPTSSQLRLTLTVSGPVQTPTLEYQTQDDGEDWNAFESNRTYTISSGDYIRIRCPEGSSNTAFGTSGQFNGCRFNTSDSFDVEGNLLYLLTQDLDSLNDTLPSEYCFAYLFKDCINIRYADKLKLPTETLTRGCYQDMFSGCTNLMTSPRLPSTTLAQECYKEMFNECHQLLVAPDLPATNLASNCYNKIFWGCNAMNDIRLAYSGDFSNTYFQDWSGWVASRGTLHYDGSDRTTGYGAVPNGWTVVPYS